MLAVSKMRGVKRDRYLQKAEMSLSEATKPLLLVTKLSGMYPTNIFWKIYTLLVSLSHSAMHFWIASTLHRKDHYKKDDWVHIVQHTCNFITLAVILGCCSIRSNRLGLPLTEFTVLDESLRSLGVQPHNDHIFKSGVVQIIVAILIPCAFGFGRFYGILMENNWAPLAVYEFMYISVAFTSIIADSLFADSLFIIRDRFRGINSIIERGGRGRVNFFAIQSRGEENEILIDVRIVRRHHHDLCTIAKKVNASFGLHLLVGVAVSLLLITGHLYQTYYSLIHAHRSCEQTFFTSTNWAIFYLGRLFVLTYSCTATSAEANHTATLLHELPTKSGKSFLREEIQDFSMQLVHESLAFTACGFFACDFTLLTGTAGAVCTFLVILIQLKDD